MNVLVLSIIFAASFWVTLRRGPGAAFVYVLIPVMMFLSQIPPGQLQPLPNFSPTATISYAVIAALICRGRFPAIKLHPLDFLVVALMLSMMCTAYSQGNFWTVVSTFGDQSLNWITPYYMARLAFMDAQLRYRGAYILACCAIGVALFAAIEFRLAPYVYARTMASLGLSEAVAEMVMVRSGFMRAQATTAHPIDLGNVGLISAAMIGVFAGSSRVKLTHPLILTGLAASVGIVVFSISFSSVAGLMAACAVYVVARYAPLGGELIPVLVFLGAVGLIYMTTQLLNVDLIVDRPDRDDAAIKGSFWVRALIAQNSWPFVTSAGFFGYGSEKLTQQMLNLASVDNSYFLMVMRRGWVYFTLWILMTLTIAISAARMLGGNPMKQIRIPAGAATAGLLGVMISMFTVWFGFTYAQLWIMLLGLFASMTQVVARAKSMPPDAPAPMPTFPRPPVRPEIPSRR
jgi:hypothetical protein